MKLGLGQHRDQYLYGVLTIVVIHKGKEVFDEEVDLTGSHIIIEGAVEESPFDLATKQAEPAGAADVSRSFRQWTSHIII